MTRTDTALELLSPAKNAQIGSEAIMHGADAVYIGGPAFGARAAAGNSVSDIGRLADFAHRYNARVLVALNTILDDDEIESARRIAWQVYEAGADALIMQDMGLLAIDLPPIALHASTQADIRTVAKARFLEDVGFSQLVLARELSLAEIGAIAAQTSVVLEFFVHGALCVSDSGRCNLSTAQTGRSANRGDCAQPCRLPYSLADQNGQIIAADRHLLSMKDNDQSANLRALIGAGVSSFKIEGRLKDLAYVKNVTAHYRRLLDAIIDEQPTDLPALRRSSAGRSSFLFTPQPEKTFNRGSTDYFVNDRQRDIAAFDSPKFVGAPIGEVTRLGRDSFEASCNSAINNGDGVTFYTATGELVGMRINRAEVLGATKTSYRLFPSLSDGRLPETLRVGTTIQRNRDQEFERQLEKKSAERRIAVRLQFFTTADGFALRVTDETGVSASAELALPKQSAQNAEQAQKTLRENLGKLGATIYRAQSIELETSFVWFIPASAVNSLRRAAIDALDAARQAAYRRAPRRAATLPPAHYPDDTLSYLGNVFNRHARAFYERHGVRTIAPAYECGQEKGEVSLMITKHCLRYSFNLCPKQVKGVRPDPLLLVNGNDTLTLRFDCKACAMHVIGKLRKQRTIALAVR